MTAHAVSRLAFLFVYCIVLSAAASATADEFKQEEQSALTLPALRLNRADYRFRAGESVKLDAPLETLQVFQRQLRRFVTIEARPERQFRAATNADGDVVLSASLTTHPGEYKLLIGIETESGERRAVNVRVILDPIQAVPSSATKPPVILLNGYQINGLLDTCPTTKSSDTFGSLEQTLLNDGVPVVYFFDNCKQDANANIETLGSDLAKFMGLIRYDDNNGSPVTQIDVIAHSMGGLIVRSYLAGGSSYMQGRAALQAPVPIKIRKFVDIATPHFGSYVAYKAFLSTQAIEMKPGSAFLWQLALSNQYSDDLRGVDALGIIGNAGWFPSSDATYWGASDGIVSVTSASLGFVQGNSGAAERTRVLNYCHTDSSSKTDGIMTCKGSGIANVDHAPETKQIIESFLGLNTAYNWRTIGKPRSEDKMWLANYGGMYFGPVDEYNDLMWGVYGLTIGTLTLDEGDVFFKEFVPTTTDTFHYNSWSRWGVFSADHSPRVQDITQHIYVNMDRSSSTLHLCFSTHPLQS